MSFSISTGRSRCLQVVLLSATIASATAASGAEPLTEAAAIDRALSRPEFSAFAAAEVDEAEARVSAIRQFDNPEASVSREQVSGAGGSETEWQAGIVQPIDLSGRRASLRAAARAEVDAVEADVARRRQERVAAVRRAYAGCAAAEAKAEVAARFTARLREAVRIVTARTDAGDTAGYDLRRLRVEAGEAEAQERLATGDAAAECATLSHLTATPDVRPATSLAAMTTAARAAADRARPDLIARERRIEAASQRVTAARRARLPEIGVGVGYKFVENESGSASGPAISIGATLPIFDNGRAAIAEAQARQRALESELALARQDIAANVASARLRAQAAFEAAELAQAASDDAARLGTIAEAAYNGGEGGVVELVDAFRTSRDAEISIVELTERAVRAIIDLELAEGGL